MAGRAAGWFAAGPLPLKWQQNTDFFSSILL
jgi:hypothetical protein